MFVDTLPPAVREGRIKLGKRVSSEITLEQALSMLKSIPAWIHVLAELAFSNSDAELLQECANLLQTHGVNRDTVAGVRSGASQEMAAADKDARVVRGQARELFQTCVDTTSEAPTEETPAIVALLQIALHASQDGDPDSLTLSRQLTALAAPLADERVAKVAETRGGPRVAARLAKAQQRLDAAEKNRPRKSGTPRETETLDIIDGTIIVLARRLRRAAKNADKVRGGGALTKLFTLDALYGSRSSSASVATPPATPALPAQEPANP